MGWVSPSEVAKYRKALEGPTPDIPKDILAPLPDAPADAPTVVPDYTPAQRNALDSKIAGSPIASGAKDIFMAAMIRALPPHLRAKVEAYGAAQKLAAMSPAPAVLDSPQATPIIIEGECKHE